MSFKVLPYNPKVRLPNADLCVDDVAIVYKLLDNVTPKIEGDWLVQIINPTIKECKQLLDSKDVPSWFNIDIYLQQKKMDQVLLEFPEYMQKEKSFKEQARELLATVNHIIDKRAFNVLVEAFRGNIADLQKTLTELDESCKGSKITLKDVQSKVNYTKPVYASDVMNAFLFHQENRWKLLNKLVLELGDSYAYYALFKYVRNLLQNKNKYLQNEEAQLRVVKRIDAPSICYAYTLFSLSSGPQQLYGVLQALDNRGREYLERITDANL